MIGSNTGNSVRFAFDYDYAKECWNLPRGSVPSPLKAQGVPHALWMHFWDYAQSVVERASVRSIMKDKLQAECHNFQLSSGNYSSDSHYQNNPYQRRRQREMLEDKEREMQKLEEQTRRDFDCLQREAERLFPNSTALIHHDPAQKRRPFGLDIQLLHSNSKSNGKINIISAAKAALTKQQPQPPKAIFHLQYDKSRAMWNFPREQLPAVLLAVPGISLADWIAVWDYGLGVNQRAYEREHLNELHDRELQICQKSLTYMQQANSSSSSSVSENNHTNTATHLGLKMDKLRRAKEANSNNTQKGWHEFHRRAKQRFEPHGIVVSLSHPVGDKPAGCGLEFHCPSTGRRNTQSPMATTSNTNSLASISVSRGGRQSPPYYPQYQHQPHQQTNKMPTISSSIWLHHKVKEQDVSPTVPTIWNSKEQQQPFIRMSSHQPAILTTSPNHSSGNSTNILRSRDNKQSENAPPKPETLRSYQYHPSKSESSPSATSSSHKSKNDAIKLPQVVLTYVHDEISSKIEVTTPLSFDDPTGSFDDEDSHGYVVPPAPSDPPSSIGSSSSISSVENSHHKAAALTKEKEIKRVRFGPDQLREFENPYKKSQKDKLWFTHKERDANRAKTKMLAQRAFDSKSSGGSTHNVVFMDSETGEEVCWRGLEHAQKGNLSSRQETRRAYMARVLEKQRSLRLDAFTFRRGAPHSDPMGELQKHAARQSRHCRERAQQLAAGDAKEARTVYKESLRKANLESDSSSNSTVSSSSSMSRRFHQNRSQMQYREQAGLCHKNDIFQDYCRQMHLASKGRLQPAVAA